MMRSAAQPQAQLETASDASYNAEELHASLKRQLSVNNEAERNLIFEALKRREYEPFRADKHRKKLMMKFVPNEPSHILANFDGQLFCGKFNGAGNVFMSASQDTKIRLYSIDDVCKKGRQGMRQGRAHPRIRRSRQGWLVPRSQVLATNAQVEQVDGAQPYRTIACRDIGWSIISTAFSPDDQWLVYSSWSNFIHLCNLQGEFERHEGFEVTTEGDNFCLFSTTFSPNATHVIGGSNDRSVYVCNLETKQVERRIRAHDDDVNAVCYLDDSGQVLMSGSDDSLIKLWDLRARTSKAQGLLSGHMAGITSLAARADGMTICSNSKDQTLKIWDVRKMLKADKSTTQQLRRMSDFDYRFIYGQRRLSGRQHPHDASLHTFTGHSVLATLIRCDFSPMHHTGQRYVYSGDAEACIYIWDLLTGEEIRVLRGHYGPVRDVSWHPYLPLIASSSWDCSVKLWEFQQGQPDDEEQGSEVAFVEDPDGREDSDFQLLSDDEFEEVMGYIPTLSSSEAALSEDEAALSEDDEEPYEEEPW